MQTLRSVFTKILAIALVALLIAGCSPAAKKARLLKRADDYYKSGEYDKAKIEYMQVLRLDPQNAAATSQLGLIWWEQGSPIRAFSFLVRSKELTPGNLKARVKLAMAYLSLGQVADARKEAIAVLQASPAEEDAILILANTASTPQELDDTSKQLQKTNGPDKAAFHLASAALALRKNDIASAKNEVLQALTLDPKSIPAHLSKANLYTFANDTARAEEEYKSAVALAPPRSNAPLEYAKFKMKIGALDEARGILSGITRQTPDYLPAWIELAQVDLADKKYDDSLKSIDNVLGRDPTNFDARLLQAQVWMAKGDAKKAEDGLEALDRTFPGTPGINYQLARAYLQNNNPTQAITVLNQAIKASPDFVDAILMLAEVNLRTGNAQTAATLMEALLKKHPGIGQGELLLAAAYRAQGQLDDAANVFRREIQAYPQNAGSSYFMLGMILRQQEKNADARAALKKPRNRRPATSCPRINWWTWTSRRRITMPRWPGSSSS